MPQGSTLLQLLRGLNKAELQAIPKRCEWCRTRKTNIPVSELSKRIRESIDTNVKKGNITYSEAMQDIRDEVLIPGPDPVAGKIRQQLRQVPTATHIGDVRIEEEWFSAQVYGALWACIERPYTVHLEYQLNTRSRPTADLYVESNNGTGDYLIEVKRAPISNGEGVKRQLKKYHRAIANDLNRDRERTFLCVIGEDTDIDAYNESRKSKPLSEYIDGIPTTIDEIGEEIDRTEVISNTLL